MMLEFWEVTGPFLQRREELSALSHFLQSQMLVFTPQPPMLILQYIHLRHSSVKGIEMRAFFFS
jgi:hypothetical protein